MVHPTQFRQQLNLVRRVDEKKVLWLSPAGKNTPKTVSLNYQIPISNSQHIMKC